VTRKEYVRMLWYGNSAWRLKWFSCFLLVGILAGCSLTSSPSSTTANHSGPNPSPTTHLSALTPFTPPTRCQPASPVENSAVGPEAHGTATNAQLWALIMSTSGIPVKAKQEVKIVWRMTGSGGVHFVAYSLNGRHVAPIWGPDEHGGSNWNRPGEEWGTGFNFPVSGCWDIHVTRDGAAGDVWLDVK
jgi:hypothetical protein